MKILYVGLTYPQACATGLLSRRPPFLDAKSWIDSKPYRQYIDKKNKNALLKKSSNRHYCNNNTDLETVHESYPQSYPQAIERSEESAAKQAGPTVILD